MFSGLSINLISGSMFSCEFCILLLYLIADSNIALSKVFLLKPRVPLGGRISERNTMSPIV